MTSSLQKPPPKIECRGNTYSKLSKRQKSYIYEELSKRRHSLDVLRKEHHILENEDPPLSIEKKAVLGLQDFAAAPKRCPSAKRRNAVAIACQWGKAKSHQNELLAICAIDVLTGEVLINSLVAPLQPMLRWLENVHGITQKKIDAAVEKHQCLRGWREARTKLLDYIDGQTILVGYTVGFDLGLLRLFHTTIVDSQVLATSAVFPNQWGKKKRPKWPMPKVCSDFLGKPIKHHAVSESCTESVFEKALVSREIALQCIQRPRDFEEWARRSRIEFFNPFNEKRPYYKMNSQNEENDRKKVKKTGNMDTNPGKDKSTGPVSDENRATTTFSQGYEAGYQAAYQAGFQSGFQMGYEQGVGKANPQESQEKIDKPDESQHENQHECHESMHYTDEEGSVDDQMETLSQVGSCDDDSAPV